MVKTLTKHGNSFALVIEKPIMDLLHIQPDTPLEISSDGRSLLIRPVDSDRQNKFNAILEKTCNQYHEAFKKLAE